MQLDCEFKSHRKTTTAIEKKKTSGVMFCFCTLLISVVCLRLVVCYYVRCLDEPFNGQFNTSALLKKLIKLPDLIHQDCVLGGKIQAVRSQSPRLHLPTIRRARVYFSRPTIHCRNWRRLAVYQSLRSCCIRR